MFNKYRTWMQNMPLNQTMTLSDSLQQSKKFENKEFCYGRKHEASCTNIAEPEEPGELSCSHEKQKIMVPVGVLLVTPCSSQENPLHGLHQENPHAHTNPWQQKIVRVLPENPCENSNRHASKCISGVGYDIQQWCLTTAQRIQQSF